MPFKEPSLEYFCLHLKKGQIACSGTPPLVIWKMEKGSQLIIINFDGNFFQIYPTKQKKFRIAHTNLVTAKIFSY